MDGFLVNNKLDNFSESLNVNFITNHSRKIS